MFINQLINFLIIAAVVFLIVRQFNRMRRQEEKAPDPTTKNCPFCATEIPIPATRCPHCTSEIPAAT